MKEITFDDLLDNISADKPSEKITIETAKSVSDLISSLIRARIEKNLSQRELAEKCGLHQSAIARMERLQVMPRLDTVARVADCLGVRLSLSPVQTSKKSIMRSDRITRPDFPRDGISAAH